MVILQTNLGTIQLELDHNAAPMTASNFVEYVKAGFYDNTIFHRVIDGFMIQGGGFTSDMQQKSTRSPIKNEANNGLKNATGTIAMARTSDPHSASAQFFINVSDNHFLNFKNESIDGWGYCVFGKVIDGMGVVNKIKQAATTTRSGHQDVPRDDIIIEKAFLADDK